MSIWSNYPEMLARFPSLTGSSLFPMEARKTGEAMKEIPLTNTDKVAIVDDETYLILRKWKWNYHENHGGHTGYAVRGTNIFDKYYNIMMHQMVAQIKFGIIPKGYFPDHIDGDGLNNTFNNIRLATISQNCVATLKRNIVGKTSKYLGVYWKKSQGKWAAQVTKNKKHIHLGYFDDEIEAAKAADKKAKSIHGDFARLNFPEEAIHA